VKFYIDGQWVDPVEMKTLDVINPANEGVCGKIALGSAKDVDKAVAAAKKAFKTWSQTTREERLDVLNRILAEYQKRFGDLALAVTEEMGAPASLAQRAQVPIGMGHLSTAINVLKDFKFEEQRGPTLLVKEPIGVCGFITPWNWPLNQIVCKVAPAIATGCTMVLKPSEVAPLSSMLFAECMHEAGFPKGVFNLVNGDGAGVGTRLSGHPDIEMISFTGSTRAGIAISKVAAESLKRVVLELGGKGANIIFADADRDAVKRGVLHCFNNTGQSCNAPTRMLVERAIYGRAVEEAKTVAEQVRVDTAHKPGKHIGPLVSDVQFRKVQGLIEKGIKEGARLVAGGVGRPEGHNKGYFVRPTVFADVNNQMTIAREEIFGPVLSIIPFDTEQQALEIANDTPYGLTNYVQSSDDQRRNRLAVALRSGMVEMNGKPRAPGAPFGGVKASGRAREGGVWGIEEFLEPKAISGWAPQG
jgi:aldehyde dehydrogenase (NAD+)